MKPSKENVFRLLAEIEQNGGFPHDGPISVFASEYPGGLRGHPYQFVVRLDGDTVFVRASRMPFARPMVFSRQALSAVKL
ncbi:MAG: hypothetical protein IKV90_07190 [Clostridia bacterium]|nr:hypothetical protein [Clostridia bacterium]